MSSPTAYKPDRFDSPIDLDLSKNEGRAPATSLLGSVSDEERLISRYPDTDPLRRRLGELHGVGEDQVLVTAGGDDALIRCFLARMGDGRRTVVTYPSFEMIPRYADQVGGRLVEVPWWQGPFPTEDVAAAASDGADAVLVVSPNNPTGAVMTETDLRKVADVTPLLILDAAYAEFADHDLTPAALEMSNAIVVRSLSKAWGLAGLRVGYLLGSAELVAEISSFGNPYPVSTLSSELALERLAAIDEVDGFVDEVKREREELAGTLEELGLVPLPSQGNFVMAECNDADWVVSAVASMGIALRWFPDRPGLEDSIRITLPGDRDAFHRLAQTLSAAVAPEALLFDLDGVLADVSNSQTRATVETARSFGVNITSQDIEEAKAAGNANDDWELTRGLCAASGVELPIEKVIDRFETLYQGVGDIPGLKLNEKPTVDSSVWRRWAETRPIGVVTGRPRPDAEEFLGRFGLRDAISVLITKEDAPFKPDPAPVRLALDRLGVTGAWLLGDTPDDIVAARDAGVIPIGVVAPGHDRVHARRFLTGAARVIDSTLDLEGLLP